MVRQQQTVDSAEFQFLFLERIKCPSKDFCVPAAKSCGSKGEILLIQEWDCPEIRQAKAVHCYDQWITEICGVQQKRNTGITFGQ
ncbi:hypothetical protein AHF37_03228 [Paragonimus kellicotti]|nr:hypothetical protein AHF37_03228 [Paragonimus kellicotti]